MTTKKKAKPVAKKAPAKTVAKSKPAYAKAALEAQGRELLSAITAFVQDASPEAAERQRRLDAEQAEHEEKVLRAFAKRRAAK